MPLSQTVEYTHTQHLWMIAFIYDIIYEEAVAEIKKYFTVRVNTGQPRVH